MHHSQALYAIRCMYNASSHSHHTKVLPAVTDDRIRELCTKVLSARDSEVDRAISELQAALREHTERARQLSAATLARLGKESKSPL